jgi:hypothetical protein
VSLALALVALTAGCVTELGAEPGAEKLRRGTQSLPPPVTERDLGSRADLGGVAPTPDLPTSATGSCPPAAGQCDGVMAQWCDATGKLQQRDCSSLGQSCGWVDPELGFYCLDGGQAASGTVPPGQLPPGADERWIQDFLAIAAGAVLLSAIDDRQYCVDVINQFRASRLLPPLARDLALEQFAAEGAMFNVLAGPHGYFMSNSGRGIAMAENEVPGWQLSGSVRDVIFQGNQMMWNEGPGGGHYETMVSLRYTKVGCGIHQAGGRVWVVMDFGR